MKDLTTFPISFSLSIYTYYYIHKGQLNVCTLWDTTGYLLFLINILYIFRFDMPKSADPFIWVNINYRTKKKYMKFKHSLEVNLTRRKK